MPATVPVAVRRAAALAFGAWLLAACDRADAPAAAPAPDAEFLVAAGDSTYWVTSVAGGVRVRGSSLFLARWGGRLAEVYVADDERAFDDGAHFAAARVYRRDLVTGDSAVVFADPAVPALAARHAARHPGVRLLDAGEGGPDGAPGRTPNDEPTDEPTDEELGRDDEDAHAAPGAVNGVTLLAAHGPYLSLESRTAVDAPDRTSDRLWRRVVDLRTGREPGLDALFGPAAAASLRAGARRALGDATAALRPAARRAAAAAAADDDAPAAAAASRSLDALATLRVDPADFTLATRGGRPAVTFVAVGRDADGLAVSLPLPPLRVPGPPPAWWARDVAPTLFVGPGVDAATVTSTATGGGRAARWRAADGAYEVRARVTADATALELVRAGGGAAPAAGARGGRARLVPVARAAVSLGRVSAPPQTIFPLDAGRADAATRRALRRAFEESAFYDDATTSVAWRRTPRAAARAPRA